MNNLQNGDSIALVSSINKFLSLIKPDLLKMKKEIKEVLREYGRGIMGGLLFSLPLLYTMEMWWRGFTAGPIYLISYVFATYLLLLGYNSYAGMKRDTSFKGVMWDSVEELGLAVVLSFLVLGIIGKISLGMSTDEILGKVIVESMMVAIGISVGTAQMGQESKGGTGKSDSDEGNDKKQNEYIKSLVLSICGAVLVASSVAPTEEIIKIAVEVSGVHLILMVILSMLSMAAVLYFVRFKGAVTEKQSNFQMAFHCVMEYIVALLVSFGLLYFFGRVSGYSLYVVLAQVIVLGVPAAIGASAGKLLIGNN